MRKQIAPPSPFPKKQHTNGWPTHSPQSRRQRPTHVPQRRQKTPTRRTQWINPLRHLGQRRNVQCRHTNRPICKNRMTIRQSLLTAQRSHGRSQQDQQTSHQRAGMRCPRHPRQLKRPSSAPTNSSTQAEQSDDQVASESDQQHRHHGLHAASFDPTRHSVEATRDLTAGFISL